MTESIGVWGRGRKQCRACPWKVSTVPKRDIPNGYCAAQHEALERTIAKPGDLSDLMSEELRMMACHETLIGAELPCVGWLAHQLGPGNNIALRLLARKNRTLVEFELDGEQHNCFEDTLLDGVE